jgi:hypothetical protein
LPDLNATGQFVDVTQQDRLNPRIRAQIAASYSTLAVASRGATVFVQGSVEWTRHVVAAASGEGEREAAAALTLEAEAPDPALNSDHGGVAAEDERPQTHG